MRGIVRRIEVAGAASALALLFAWGGGVASADGAPGNPPVAPTVQQPDDAPAKVAALEVQVKSHTSDHQNDAMRQDLPELMRLLPTLTDPKLRSRVVALVTSILDAASDDAVVKAAIKAVGDTGDPATYRALKRYLQQPNVKENPPLLMDAIDAAAKIKADESVGALMAIVEKSKKFDSAAAAIKALGNFGASKRMRKVILTDLISTVRKDVPGIGYDPDKGDPSQRQKRVRTGEEAATRWDALSSALVPALNQLTGQNAATALDWFELFDRYKNRLDQIFAS